jgi:hypothetical protein
MARQIKPLVRSEPNLLVPCQDSMLGKREKAPIFREGKDPPAVLC